MGDDLFSAAASERLRAQAPLAARLRPRTLDEIVGQEHLVGPGRPMRRLVEQDRLTSAILWGPPGTGKTTLAEVVALTTERAFERLSAVSAGVKDVREVIERARDRLGQHGRGTILFLDEIHRFSKSQQDALLPAVEDGTLTLIGATTENPFFEVNPPLRSRSTLFRLEPLDRAAIETLVRRGLEAEAATADEDAIAHLLDRAGGDGRQVLTSLEVAVALARPGPVTAEHVEAALGTSALRYGRDDHYDVISAFIKSIRGSDPDAGLYWLAAHARSGRGRPLHRPAAHHPRQRGRRDGRPAGARRGRGRRPRRRARRPARGAAQPGAGRRPSGDRAEEQPGGARHLERPQRRARRQGRARCRRTCATPTTAVPERSVTGPATSTLMTTREDGWHSSTGRANSPITATTNPPGTGSNRRSPVGWRRCTRKHRRTNDDGR